MKKYILAFLISTITMSCYSADAEVTTVEPLDSAYVVTSNFNANTLSFCPINSSTGVLSACTSFTPAVSGSNLLSSPAGSTFNSVTNTLYITNQANDSITMCTYSSTTSSATCNNYTDSTLISPSGVAVSSDGSMLYVTNAGTTSVPSQYVSVCSLDTSSGQITNTSSNPCISSPTGTYYGSGIAVLSSSSVYVSGDNNPGQISQCTASGSALSNCAVAPDLATGSGGVQVPTGIAISSDGSTLYAGSGYKNHVTSCPIANFGACTAVYDNTFVIPATLALYTSPSTLNTYLYAANGGYPAADGFPSVAGTVSICSVVDDSVQTPCTSFSDPTFTNSGNQWNLNGISVMASS